MMVNGCVCVWRTAFKLIKPRHMREGYGNCLGVCVCVSAYLSVIALAATYLVYIMPKVR